MRLDDAGRAFAKWPDGGFTAQSSRSRVGSQEPSGSYAVIAFRRLGRSLGQILLWKTTPWSDTMNVMTPLVRDIHRQPIPPDAAGVLPLRAKFADLRHEPLHAPGWLR